MESKTTNNNAIKEVRKLFNEVRSNLSREETKRIREKLYKKEGVYNFLKEKEQNGSLTNRQKNVFRNVERYLKNISTHLKNFKKHFKKYQYGLDYLFNKHNQENNTSNNVIFYLKKQSELGNNSIKERLSIIF